jgi:5-phospho-D-xylono-1,4-lactonase
MTFVRTVLGDIDPADLGVTYAHEHLVIAGGRPVQLFPDLRLDDVGKAVQELVPARELGLGAVVDAMPADAGRDAPMLAEISRRSGIHVVAATGLHHERYYDDRHWSVRLSVEAIAGLFAADITDGIDAFDYAGPIVQRTPHRAGVIKVAGSDGGPSERDRPIFAAVAEAHLATGCPILTHCEHGTGALEQIAWLAELGVDPRHVILSHTDKIVDRGYHREILSSGAVLEYDQSFRWKDAENGTLTLLEWMVADGFVSQLVLGLDAARRAYWKVHGGSPGMTYLLDEFAARMRERGLDDIVQRQLFVTNPARAYTFARPVGDVART